MNKGISIVLVLILTLMSGTRAMAEDLADAVGIEGGFVVCVGCEKGRQFDSLGAKDGFVTLAQDGRLWIFREGCDELHQFLKDGEIAKHTTRPAVGPLGATVKAPDSLAIAAIMGEPPVPVPPPIPQVRNTMSVSTRRFLIFSPDSSAAFLPISGSAPEPSPLVRLSPI